MTSTETMTRSAAIDMLRTALMAYTDEDTSLCKAAADRGIFCGGFARFSEEELRTRYDWIVKRRPDIAREDLEDLANIFQLARQEVLGLPCACDVQRIERHECAGWNIFTNREIEDFLEQVTGRKYFVS